MVAWVAEELPSIRLDGSALDVATIVAIAEKRVAIEVPADASERVAASHLAAGTLAAAGAAYGINTGVGANRTVAVEAAGGDHALRIWASHAAATGPLLDEVAVRAMMTVRLNQLAVGHSSLSPAVFEALRVAFDAGVLPAVHRYGAVGTGDLTALAELALCLCGGRPWWRGEGAGLDLVVPAPGDGVALLSSNALTVGITALATSELEMLARAGVVIAALSATSAGAAPETYDPVAWRGLSGAQSAAAALFSLVPGPGRRLQDPYPLRAAPAWCGPLLSALDALATEVAAQANRGAENPLVDVTQGRLVHHASLMATGLAARIDSVLAALVPFAQGSLSRLCLLHDPQVTGLRAFLADGPPGSSGTMACEYTATAALAELTRGSVPASTGWAVLSLGQEAGASFATQGAFAARAAAAPLSALLAAELVVAARAARWVGPPQWAGDAMTELPEQGADHDLTPDLDVAARLLPRLAAQYPGRHGAATPSALTRPPDRSEKETSREP
jgi:histidine ammonia-lyase